MSSHSETLTLSLSTFTSHICKKTKTAAPHPNPTLLFMATFMDELTLQQHVNRELSDVQAGFRKGRGTRDQIANIR